MIDQKTVVRSLYREGSGRIPWSNLIKYPFRPHHPFKVEDLGMEYTGVRELIVIIRELIFRDNPQGYSLELNNAIKQEILTQLKLIRRGEVGKTLDELLKDLSKMFFEKGGRKIKMFEFQKESPCCNKCGTPLPEKITRVHYPCRTTTIQEIKSKEFYDNLTSGYSDLQQLYCEKCKKYFRVRNIICPICNPEDEFGKDYMFKDQIVWNSSRIDFNPEFFNTVLKGIAYEQEIYNLLKSEGSEEQILISTKVETGDNDGWGLEIDLLFAERHPEPLFSPEWNLWAIEAKNHAGPITGEELETFYKNTSKITHNLVFFSKNNNFTPAAKEFASNHGIQLGSGTDIISID